MLTGRLEKGEISWSLTLLRKVFVYTLMKKAKLLIKAYRDKFYQCCFQKENVKLIKYFG